MEREPCYACGYDCRSYHRVSICREKYTRIVKVIEAASNEALTWRGDDLDNEELKEYEEAQWVLEEALKEL